MREHVPTARIVRGGAFFLALLVAWEVAVRLFRIPDWLVPSPSQIAVVIVEKHWIVLGHTLVTFEEAAIGFLISTGRQTLDRKARP